MITLTINRREYKFNDDLDMPLLWFSATWQGSPAPSSAAAPVCAANESPLENLR
jgi:hypothetical protein